MQKGRPRTLSCRPPAATGRVLAFVRLEQHRCLTYGFPAPAVSILAAACCPGMCPRCRRVHICVRCGGPLVGFFLRLLARDPIPLLELAYQFVFLSTQRRDIIIGKLAPALLDVPFELFPFPFKLIGIHSPKLLPPWLLQSPRQRPNSSSLQWAWAFYGQFLHVAL